MARLNLASAEVAADQGEVNRLNTWGLQEDHRAVRRVSKLIGFLAIRKKLVVFIPAANYCCRVATQVAKKLEGTGSSPPKPVSGASVHW
jgi:hypothetical protein